MQDGQLKNELWGFHRASRAIAESDLDAGRKQAEELRELLWAIAEGTFHLLNGVEGAIEGLKVRQNT